MSVNVVETAPVESNTSQDSEVDQVLDNYTLDDLLKLSADDVAEFVDDASHKGMKPIKEWLPNVPADVRKHLANIRADYTRKTQELAKMRKEVEEAKATVSRQNESLMNGALAKKLENIDEAVEYDLFDTEGMKAEIQRQAQLMLKSMLAPAQEELQIQQRRIALDQFKAQNPELTDPEYRGPIVELLKSRPELKLEDAFYIVKAQVDGKKLASQKEALKETKLQNRELIQKSSSGSRAAPTGTPKFKNALDAYKWHKSQQVKK